jgi:hypothetical protein
MRNSHKEDLKSDNLRRNNWEKCEIETYRKIETETKPTEIPPTVTILFLLLQQTRIIRKHDANSHILS